MSHTVHFYSNDAALLSEFVPRLAAILDGGGAAVVIVTRSHRQAIRGQLSQRGFDPIRLARQGRWVELDAEETIDELMVGDRPDGDSFASTVGAAIDRAASAVSTGGKAAPVMVYGDMVAVLWEQGKPQAALALEQLWSNLAERRRFQLSCGLPLHLFHSEVDGLAVQKICLMHTDVTPRIGSLRTMEGPRRAAGLLWRLKSQALLQRASHIARRTLGYYRDAPFPQSIDVTEVIEDVLAAYRHRFRHKEISLRKRIQANLRLLALPAEVDQIISNLVSDAIDVSPRHGAIWLRVWRSHDPKTGVPGIRIVVADRGKAHSVAARRIALGPAFASPGDTRERLGLWMAKDQLERRGGWLRCRVPSRNSDAGALLMLFLPGETAPAHNMAA